MLLLGESADRNVLIARESEFSWMTYRCMHIGKRRLTSILLDMLMNYSGDGDGGGSSGKTKHLLH